MKCTLSRNMQAQNPAYSPVERIEAIARGEQYEIPAEITLSAGHEIDHADAWRLVRIGVATPADDECRIAAGMSPQQIQLAQSKYAHLSKGIEDYKKNGENKNAE